MNGFRPHIDGIPSWAPYVDANSLGLTGNDLASWLANSGLGIAEARRHLVPVIGRNQFTRCLRLGTGPLPAAVAHALSAAMAASAPGATADKEPGT